MKIIHLHHSGFLIQFEDKTLIFDCFTKIPNNFMRAGLPHYFFVTHGHSDHYSKDILKIGSEFQPTYIFSDDLPETNTLRNYRMAPYQHMTLGGMDIRTFGSTDLGVSFYIATNSHRIFHAGDLNWWDWDPTLKPEIDPAQEEKDFKTELAKLKGLPMEFAFIPVDPRLGDSFYKAGKYFIEEFHPKVLIPMHFLDDFSIIKKFKEKVEPTETIIPDFKGRNTTLKNQWSKQH